MKKTIFTLSIALIASFCIEAQNEKAIQIIAEMDIRPGNVAVSPSGRVFTTIHPLVNPTFQLVEITGKNSYENFPSTSYQNDSKTPSTDKLDAPLGIRIDNQNRLWLIDAGLNLGTTRLFAFDIETKKEVFRYDFPQEIAPKGSFVQDLAVDEKNGWVYLADIGNPGILALHLETKKTRRFANESVQAEKVDMIIDGQLINFGGAPASVAINPITLSADKETLFYGAMNGTTWYQLPTEMFRNGRTDYDIDKNIKIMGPKPVSDGAATDASGNHYFTNIQHYGIDVLTSEGDLKPLIRDAKIDWPDNVSLGPDGWIYMTVNQLHKTPAFTGGTDEGKGPFYIYRMKLE
ncbi:L-dopachrome tautomerase-related protein [Flagellimonas meridianipacifica]|uniref:Major royal jelly protein n=1 Tax=Flagellimonas meridianipacifica TaxID=1080225 RepID=A0A2T0MC05_9FLAO|nr:L-dopachrome tautomerase-related protein [Allomuricauda pacifica]PRX55016.1 major royal jelly protein [Allomuricauda pacifica]